MDEDGSIEYDDSYGYWNGIGKATLAHNDNSDAIEQFNSLKEHCSQTKNCPMAD